MRILVYGAGVLGGNLTSNLFQAKQNVTLLARGHWAETIRKKGLIVQNRFRRKPTVSRLTVITELKPEDIYDVIFVVMRCMQLDRILDTLRANRTKNIVFVGNNVRARYYAGLLPEKNVLFAFSLSAGHRETDKIVGIDLKKITIGQLRDAPSNENLIHQIFDASGYKVIYEPNMEDYLNQLINANLEGYRAIEKGGHEILPKSDRNYESPSYRRICYAFFKLMCITPLGKICASDHAMNAVDEMSALNRDLKQFFDEVGVPYETWKQIEKTAEKYLKHFF